MTIKTEEILRKNKAFQDRKRIALESVHVLELAIIQVQDHRLRDQLTACVRDVVHTESKRRLWAIKALEDGYGVGR